MKGSLKMHPSYWQHMHSKQVCVCFLDSLTTALDLFFFFLLPSENQYHYVLRWSVHDYEV